MAAFGFPTPPRRNTRQMVLTGFKPMLDAAVNQFDWAYLDGIEQDIDLRNFWLFMLWRVHSHGSLKKCLKKWPLHFLPC